MKELDARHIRRARLHLIVVFALIMAAVGVQMAVIFTRRDGDGPLMAVSTLIGFLALWHAIAVVLLGTALRMHAAWIALLAVLSFGLPYVSAAILIVRSTLALRKIGAG